MFKIQLNCQKQNKTTMDHYSPPSLPASGQMYTRFLMNFSPNDFNYKINVFLNILTIALRSKQTHKLKQQAVGIIFSFPLPKILHPFYIVLLPIYRLCSPFLLGRFFYSVSLFVVYPCVVVFSSLLPLFAFA